MLSVAFPSAFHQAIKPLGEGDADTVMPIIDMNAKTITPINLGNHLFSISMIFSPVMKKF
jgi:hypothetical protein